MTMAIIDIHSLLFNFKYLKTFCDLRVRTNILRIHLIMDQNNTPPQTAQFIRNALSLNSVLKSFFESIGS